MATSQKQEAKISPQDTSYKDCLLASLENLRQDSLLCDVILNVNHQTFQAHRCILTAGSPYFRGVFTSDMKEKEATELDLNFLDADAMDPLLKYMYTGDVEISEANARNLVSAADFLLIQSLKTIGCGFLESIICPGNCFELRDFAEKYNCDQLKATATTFIVNNFAAASESEGFRTVEYKVLYDLISRDELVVSREEEVYEAIISWVQYDLDARRDFFEDLFSELRLVSISKHYLTEAVEKENLVSESFECTKSLLKAMKSFAVYEFEGLKKPRKVLEKHVNVIVLCGGNRSRDVVCFIPDESKWSVLTESSIARDEHAVTVCDNVLFAFGTNQTENSQIVEQFNVCTNTWSLITNLPQPRCALTAVTSNEQIYILGGRTQHIGATNNVMRYDPSINKWFYETPMNSSRAGLCAVGVGGFIYALSGINNKGEFLNTAEKYDPRAKVWTDTPPMQTARYYASSAALNMKIYVVGGQVKNGSCLSSGEVYDVKTDQWTALPGLSVPRQAAGMSRWGNKLYLFGGCNNSGRLDSVECFDLESNVWEFVAKMPAARSWVQCGVLRLPKQLVV